MARDPADVQGPLAEIRLTDLQGHRPRKRFGQHFLTDQGVIHRILDGAGLDPWDRVLEIGPGRGGLTFPMARRVDRILAVEKDRDLAGWLREELPSRGAHNVSVICEDILRFDFDLLERFSPDPILLVGNLPYNVSTPVLERLIRHRRHLRRAVLMFQKEVAERLAAAPGSRSYGALTVLVGIHARVRLLLRVGKASFHPKPQVESAVVELDFEAPHPERPKDEAWFRKVVRGAFGLRRKTLQNALSASFSGCARDDLRRTIAGCGIDPNRRAETLSIEEFLRLSDVLGRQKP